jgi:flagellar assembly factor FliW
LILLYKGYGEKMKIKTRYHEEIEINQEEIVLFGNGIPGFQEDKEYVVLSLGNDSPFSILQAVKNEELGFVIVDPFSIYPKYEFDLDDSVVSQLQIEDKADILIFSIVTLGESLSKSTINLQAPIIINQKKKLGKQAILNTDNYHTKHSISTGKED